VVKKVKKYFPPPIPPSPCFSRQFVGLSILQPSTIKSPNEISPKKGDRSGEQKNVHDLTRIKHAGPVFREVFSRGGSA
jgi:hypothetical protein